MNLISRIRALLLIITFFLYTPSKSNSVLFSLLLYTNNSARNIHDLVIIIPLPPLLSLPGIIFWVKDSCQEWYSRLLVSRSPAFGCNELVLVSWVDSVSWIRLKEIRVSGCFLHFWANLVRSKGFLLQHFDVIKFLISRFSSFFSYNLEFKTNIIC